MPVPSNQIGRAPQPAVSNGPQLSPSVFISPIDSGSTVVLQPALLTSRPAADVRRRAPTDSHAISISPVYQQLLADLQVRERQRLQETTKKKSEDDEEKKVIFLYWYPQVRTVRL